MKHQQRPTQKFSKRGRQENNQKLDANKPPQSVLNFFSKGNGVKDGENFTEIYQQHPNLLHQGKIYSRKRNHKLGSHWMGKLF